MKKLLGAIPLLIVLGAPSAPFPQQARRTTIVDLSHGGSYALLVGGWDGKRWLADKSFHKSVRSGERYRFYGLTAMAGEAKGGEAVLSEASGSAWQIEIKSPPSSGEDLIGLTGGWNPMPRKPQVVSDTAPFRRVVASVLKQRGVSKAPVNITRVLRVDLDGNGSLEEIISATCPRLANDKGEAMAQSARTDYSLVLLRFRSGSGYSSTVLRADYGGKDVTPLVNEIGGAMDLNGDGKLEIVLRARYYEGAGARVFTFESGKARQVLYAMDGA